MDPNTHRQSDALVVLDVVMQCRHRLEDLQASPYCSVGIVLMGLGVAKVDQESIAQELRYMPVIALDDRGARGLVGPHDVPIFFRVKLRGQGGGIDQVAEHDR
jgi:hypothetical protein